MHKAANGKKPTSQYFDVKQSFGERWASEYQKAFELLVDKLTSSPVLGFADPKQPYIWHTDASTTGLGAALYQQQERGFSPSESCYPAHKLEFLALKLSVTKRFNDYLYGANFTVVTDSNPLTYILTSAKLDATIHRWLAALSTYSFKLQYRAGRQNYDGDALSRQPHHSSDQGNTHASKEQNLVEQFFERHMNESEGEISSTIVDVVCENYLTSAATQVTLAESLSMHVNGIPESYHSENLHGLPDLPALSPSELRHRQLKDPVISHIIHQLVTGENVISTLRKELPDLSLLLKELNKLELRDGILYPLTHVTDSSTKTHTGRLRAVD